MTELPLNQVLCGDCAELLQGFPDNSVDLVVTDPPYGLGFMGKEWDKALPPKAAFKEVIRVLKPGGLAFVMSSPRQDLLWRMCALLEGVGFEMRQSFISWIYKTGFPKAYDVSKGIDKKFGELDNRKIIGVNEEFRKKVKAEIERGQGNINKNMQLKGLTNSEAGYQNPDKIGIITEPATTLGQKWNGWKSQTGLKPALEPILMVNKPFSESTIVDNVLRWGTGAINVDATRIPFHNKEDSDYVEGKHDSVEGIPRAGGNAYQWKDYEGKRTNGYTPLGRFPANLLVSDRAIDTGELNKSGAKLPHHKMSKKADVYGEYKEMTGYDYPEDIGDQSRYFDLDAWAQHYGLLDVPKPNTSERDYGLKGKKTVPKSKFNLNDGSKDERFDGVIPTPRRNTHPTVKPIKLMAYLIELGCPRNGVVLDPFVGSGTTCIAAKQLGRRYIGIEINPEYHVLAEARVAAYPQPLEWFQEAQDVH